MHFPFDPNWRCCCPEGSKVQSNPNSLPSRDQDNLIRNRMILCGIIHSRKPPAIKCASSGTAHHSTKTCMHSRQRYPMLPVKATFGPASEHAWCGLMGRCLPRGTYCVCGVGDERGAVEPSYPRKRCRRGDILVFPSLDLSRRLAMTVMTRVEGGESGISHTTTGGRRPPIYLWCKFMKKRHIKFLKCHMW